MRPWPVLTFIFALSMCFAGRSAADVAARDTDDAPLQIVVPGRGTILTSTGTYSDLRRRESAGPDTFDLYGGPRRVVRDPDGIAGSGDEYVEGKFEDASGFLPRGLSDSPNDWTEVDLTDQRPYWNVATFNATNLNGNGADNRAIWSGLPAGTLETAGWETAPGYGHGWNDVLLYESDPVANPGLGQTVGLDFVFNFDTEPGYDFVVVEYDSAGTWTSIYERSGTNRDPDTQDFPAPGLRFAQQPQVRPIVYAGNDYGDDGRVRIRIRFTSDGAFSDQDGFFDSDGAVQLDDIIVTTSLGTFVEDFESDGPYLFTPQRSAIAGSFAVVFSSLTDLDECAENRSPQLTFIDFGQEPVNGPGVTGATSTGGSLSANWDYGRPGGFVVNYTGGLDGVPLDNQVWSPAIEWDLPGPEDDDPDIYGSALYYSVYSHAPLMNGMFSVWFVRTFTDGAWGDWQDRNFVYFSATPDYQPTLFGTTDLIEPNPERVQIALGVIDLAEVFGFPGTDATPSPFFDDVRFYKYRIGGPALSTRMIDMANDGFPVSGEIAVGTQAQRDLLDVRFDMARDISSGDLNVPGDSIVVNATAILPGTEIADVRMKWALRQNPTFESTIRQQPARVVDEDFTIGTDASGRIVWTGSVVMSFSTFPDGTPIVGLYFADLPDEDFLYPGDVLHYYVQATDSDGRVSTLPNDTSGFGTWDDIGQSTFSRTWSVRALPTITDDGGAQPSILVYNDFGRRGNENEIAFGLGGLGLIEGIDYDTYTTQGPSSQVSNGIGSAGVDNPLGDRRGHGANADQLAGYDTIFYLAGNLNTGLISDGSNEGQNDKSPDLAVMTGWKNLPGPRNTVYFGDFVASALGWDSPVEGAVYTQNVMGVDPISSDVRSEIDGQTAPTVRPRAAAFEASFIAYGGCQGINQFDSLRPVGTAIAGHGFVDPSTDTLYPEIAASVVYDRIENISRKIDITFPFGLQYIRDDISRRVGLPSTRSRLLQEVLTYFDSTFVPSPDDAIDTPSPRPASVAVHPNPFNPKTTVTFVLPRAGVAARVEVFNVRGERVRVLHDGVADDDELALTWNGTDERGARVSSGVYLVRATTEDFSGTKKTVLVK